MYNSDYFDFPFGLFSSFPSSVKKPILDSPPDVSSSTAFNKSFATAANFFAKCSVSCPNASLFT